MNALVQRVAATVEIDKPALMHAVSVHLQIGATLTFLEPHRFEIDPIDELPRVNSVPVNIDGATRQFGICLVLLGPYCNPEYVLLEETHDPMNTSRFDTFVLYRDFGDQPQRSVCVPRDLESLSENEREQLMRNIVAEFYKR